MTKKITSILLAAAMLSSALCAGGSVTASADEQTYTYYFLAPDEWFDTSLGALNEDIGCYWWQPEENGKWPGTKMTPAPEIGENVYKITDVPKDVTALIFNNSVSAYDPYDPSLIPYSQQTVNINTEGYDKYEARELYDGCKATDNFDNYIYVMDLDQDYTGEFEWTPFSGAWFTLDDYKNHPDYYGTYNIGLKPSNCTYYFAAPDSWFKTDKGAENADIGAVLYSDFTQGGTDDTDRITEKMTPAPEIGENIFKLENVPYKYNYIQFYDYTDIKPHRVNGEAVYPSDAVSTRGYSSRTKTCPYDRSVKCPSFSGMIYVFDMDYSHEYSRYGDSMVQDGEWFTPDSYKNYTRYYGSYKNPDSPEYDVGGCTYYFLAPESWCSESKEPGESGIVIGSKDVNGSEGQYLMRAPEIGENVYVAKDVSPNRTEFRFASWQGEFMGDCTRVIFTDGYNGNCPYDAGVETENFNGWIYVLDGATDSFGDAFGAWFTVDDYKNHADYYGTYGFDKETPDAPSDLHETQRFTLYFLAPDDWIKTEAGAKNDKIGYILEKTTAEQNAEYPGAEMTPAPEIGENVFKMTGLLPEDFDITFTNYTVSYDNDIPMYSTRQSVKVKNDGSCPYDGMICLIDPYTPKYDTGTGFYSEWCTLDSYKDSDLYKAYDLDSAEEMTYYFLAPDSWFNTEKGAFDEDVFCSTWTLHTDMVDYANKMTPAPEIGRNVFKITLSKYVKTLVFRSSIDRIVGDDGKPLPGKYMCYTGPVDIGYHGDCPYDSSFTTDSFDGMIYVLDCSCARRYIDDHINYPRGAWFTLDDYTDHKDYYGTYTFVTGGSEADMPIFDDVDYDGAVTSADALELLRISVGLTEYSEEFINSNFDIDGDGIVTSADALEVLRASVA